jgi:hypothetical protein
VSDEKYEYTRTHLILGNVALLLWIAVASVAFWFYNPLTFWFFLIFVAFMVFAILRRLGCSTCAYCKPAPWGSEGCQPGSSANAPTRTPVTKAD